MGFKKETELCAEFMKLVPKEWTVYPETGGFDILLVRGEDGFQIGVEAKLRLNAKVISQAAETSSYWAQCLPGPDSRAILIPDTASAGLARICALIGIEVIKMRRETRLSYRQATEKEVAEQKMKLIGQEIEHLSFYPDLPKAKHSPYDDDRNWFEHCPVRRIRLPDYVPDTIAGDKSPVMLTDWKIRAMKLAVLLNKTGYLTRYDFKKLQVSMSRWVQGGLHAWLIQGDSGWVKSSKFPDFLLQHPINYKQIEADFDKWNPRKEEIL